MKRRQLIGTLTLDKAIEYYNDRIPIATIVRVLKIDTEMHYRTAFNIIKADILGYTKVTRPDWLKPEPMVQTAPEGLVLLNGMTDRGYWLNI